MLSKITFKAGSSPGQPPLSLDYKPSVTIFVGPNYSGKSVALAEIAGFVTDGKVVARIERPAWSREAAVTYLSSRKRPTPPGQVTHADHTYLDDPDGQSVLVHNPSFLAEMQQGVVNNMWRRHYAVPRSLFLTGENRTGMLSAHPRGDLRDPKNPFERLTDE